MTDAWRSLQAPAEGAPDPLGLREKMAEAARLYETDPGECARLLAGLAQDLQDAAVPVDVFRVRLDDQVAQWVADSVDRLKTSTRAYFDEARREIMAQIDREVSYGTPFSEMLQAGKEGMTSWLQQREFESAVRKFFRDRCDDSFLGAELSSCRSKERELRHTKVIGAPDTRAAREAALNEERNTVKERLKAIEQDGLERFEQLKQRGFFRLGPHEREGQLRDYDGRLVPAFAAKGWLPSEPASKFGDGLLGTLLEQRFGDAAMGSFQQRFFAQEQRHFEEYWTGAIEGAARTTGPVGFALSSTVLPGADSRISAEAATAVLATLAPFAAAGVLAAGWRTMAWAMLNLFPPMLLVTAPIAIWAVVAGKESSRKEMKEQAGVFIDRLQAGQLQSVETTYARLVERASRELIDSVTTKAYTDHTGLGSRRAIVRFVSELNAGAVALTPLMQEDQPDFLAISADALGAGDMFAAAALAALAFEATVNAWLHTIGASPSMSADFLRRSVDCLLRNSAVPAHVSGHLKRLRPVRNRWAHGMDDLVRLPPNDRAERIRNFIETLRSIRP